MTKEFLENNLYFILNANNFIDRQSIIECALENIVFDSIIPLNYKLTIQQTIHYQNNTGCIDIIVGKKYKTQKCDPSFFVLGILYIETKKSKEILIITEPRPDNTSSFLCVEPNYFLPSRLHKGENISYSKRDEKIMGKKMQIVFWIKSKIKY